MKIQHIALLSLAASITLATILEVALGLWRENFAINDPEYILRVHEEVEDDSGTKDSVPVLWAREVQCKGGICTTTIRFSRSGSVFERTAYDCRSLPCKELKGSRR